VLPVHWLAASATGSAETCARRVLDQFDAGADSVILHGATPTELTPVIEAWRTIRPTERFTDLPVNPGLTLAGALRR
jgi:5,10-methylenetetrahydromethanopterin reductase